jgi:RNA recognition motif-containing protein
VPDPETELIAVELYVGNLPFSATNEDLRSAFGQFGEIEAAQIILDRDTKKSRGFAFVKLSREGGTRAITALHGQEFMGRRVVVNESKPWPRVEHHKRVEGTKP